MTTIERATLILSQLREKTQSAHESIEQTVDVMRTDLTVEHYQRLLLAFYTFYRPLEMKLEAARNWDSSRSKLPWLVSDLTTLGFKMGELSQFSVCDDLPACDSAAHALGIMYVLEGSTLGGQLITKHLRETQPTLPSRFFESYGVEIGPRWRGFIKNLEEWSKENSDRTSDVVQAATETFSKLSKWLLKWKQSYQH